MFRPVAAGAENYFSAPAPAVQSVNKDEPEIKLEPKLEP